MAVEIVNATGIPRLERALRGLLLATIDTQPAMQLIAGRWANRVRAGFRTSTDPYGRRWAPTLRPGQPLRDTGRLQRSIGHKATRDLAVVGTNVCYAIVHQTGARVRAGRGPHQSLCGYQTKGAPYLRFSVAGQFFRVRQVRIPARPIFPSAELGGLPRAYEDEAAEVVIAHLRRGLRNV